MVRVLAEPFVVAAPAGMRVRTSLRVSAAEHEVLRAVGELLGELQGRDLRERCLSGGGPKHLGRAERKKALTAESSSRWAGSITRTTGDQWERAKLNLLDRRTGLRRAIHTIERRCAVRAGERRGRVRGYATKSERYMKQLRLQALRLELAEAEERLASGSVSVCRGGKGLARKRDNLDAAGMSEAEWEAEWEASRSFLTADGDSQYPFGNGLIWVDPADGTVTVSLPKALAHLSNTPGGRALFEFSNPVGFAHKRADEWAAHIAGGGPVSYDLSYAPRKGRWYLDASWGLDPAPGPTLDELREHPVLAVDLNADHFACHVLTSDGNPKGGPATVECNPDGPSDRRTGQRRAAIGAMLDIAEQHGCRSVAMENLGFDDARQTGRETMGRGKRGKKFRKTVASMAIAGFATDLAAMAHRRRIAVVAVDAAYTSRWGRQHWLDWLNHTRSHKYTPHHAATIVIGRRCLGHKARTRSASRGRSAGAETPQRRGAGQPANGLAENHESAQPHGQPDGAPAPAGRSRPPPTRGEPGHLPGAPEQGNSETRRNRSRRHQTPTVSYQNTPKK